MKNILKINAVILLTLLVFSCTNVYATTPDKKGPSCTINVNNKLKMGTTINGYISCYDDNELDDLTITTQDFSIYSRFLGRVKILSISQGYKSSNNSKYYRWDFKIKGVFFGNVNVQLKPGVITDIYGNKNYSSTTAVIKVGLK